MAGCSADNQSIDCGEGHGCAIVCTHDGRKCWAMCGSRIRTMFLARGKNKTLSELRKLNNLEFNCHQIKLANLVQFFQKVLPYKVGAPRSKTSQRMTMRSKGSLDDIVRSTGLIVLKDAAHARK
jgi:hypothetical protein